MKIDLSAYTKECSCGKNHPLEVKDIIIKIDAFDQLPNLLSKYQFNEMSHIYMVCDENTFAAAGSKIKKFLPYVKEIILPIIVKGQELHADNQGVELLESNMGSPDLLLAVGAGTIHDLTRYVAARYKIPFISIPTAASVDGFVSTVCAMTWDGFKKTLPGISPLMVVADTGIIMEAPYRLTASGISDLIAKYIAVADWRISNLLSDEYICHEVCKLEIEAINYTLERLDGFHSPNKEEKIASYETLIFSLLLSGIAMQMIGNSRPASGAEHHISHLLEMELFNETIPFYHGEKVSVGLILILEEYKKSKALFETGKYTIRNISTYDKDMDLLKEHLILKNRLGIFQTIVGENTPNSLEQVKIERFFERKESIVEILENLPKVNVLKEILKKSGCLTSLQDIHLKEEYRENILRFAPFVRNRLTWLRVGKLLDMENRNAESES